MWMEHAWAQKLCDLRKRLGLSILITACLKSLRTPELFVSEISTFHHIFAYIQPANIYIHFLDQHQNLFQAEYWYWVESALNYLNSWRTSWIILLCVDFLVRSASVDMLNGNYSIIRQWRFYVMPVSFTLSDSMQKEHCQPCISFWS